jgi:DNA-binding transcriptional regulator YiaG
MAKLDLEQLRHTPAYSFGEAAHYLSMPTATLRAWCVGQKQGNKKEFIRLIELDGAPREGLSLLNLVEAHVLASIRRIHNVAGLTE